MQSYLWSDGVYRTVPEYQGCRHYGVDTCGTGDGKQILPRTGIPCAAPQANACPQLCEGWRDVSKELPPDSNDYLVYTDQEWTIISHLWKGKWWDECYEIKVIAWRPLPDPPAFV